MRYLTSLLVVEAAPRTQVQNPNLGRVMRVCELGRGYESDRIHMKKTTLLSGHPAAHIEWRLAAGAGANGTSWLVGAAMGCDAGIADDVEAEGYVA
jgi:hypothetical protein